MNNHKDKEEHDIMRLSRNFQRGNTVQQRTELAKVLRMKEAKEKANKAAEILYEAFWKDFDVKKDDGFRRYHITKKDWSVQWLKEGQMVMTVQPDGSLIIRLNSPKWDTVYTTNKLSNEDFSAEIPALKLFIEKDVEMPEKSKIQKY